jgi:hypothetical protein
VIYVTAYTFVSDISQKEDVISGVYPGFWFHASTCSCLRQKQWLAFPKNFKVSQVMDKSFTCESIQFMVTPKCYFPMKPGLMQINIQITSISESQIRGLNRDCSVIHPSHIADFKFKSHFYFGEKSFVY